MPSMSMPFVDWVSDVVAAVVWETREDDDGLLLSRQETPSSSSSSSLKRYILGEALAGLAPFTLAPTATAYKAAGISSLSIA